MFPDPDSLFSVTTLPDDEKRGADEMLAEKSQSYSMFLFVIRKGQDTQSSHPHPIDKWSFSDGLYLDTSGRELDIGLRF